MSSRQLRVLPFLILLGVACGSEDNMDGMQAGSGAGAAGIGMPTAGTSAPAAGMTGGTMAPTGGTGGSAGVAGAMAGVGGVGATGGTTGGMGGAAGDGMMPGDCEGFPMEGLVYSPGGDVLPNTCMPFHPTTNNPYAVRCVDAWPWYETGFPGDNFCILPPPPDKGLQYGVHPQGLDWFAQVSTGDMSGYERANISDDFIMQPADEGEFNYATSASNTEPQNYYRHSARMRSGSHHMIVANIESSQALETWGPGAPVGLNAGTDGLPGAQRPDENTPKSLEKPAEDAGYYAIFSSGKTIIFDMHHFNATDAEILKEAWTNIWFEDDATKLVSGLNGLDLTQTFFLAVQPNTTVDLHYSFNVTEPVRIVTLFGHRHAWTTNFSAWVVDGSETEILYQSFDWYDEPTYRYDSLTENPVPDHSLLSDGAATGIRVLQPGQVLHYNCRIQYTAERGVKVDAPVTPMQNGTLGFANEAFTAEMCILFGSTAEGTLGRVAANASPLPAFATAQ